MRLAVRAARPSGLTVAQDDQGGLENDADC
jgi:hypothetical protein